MTELANRPSDSDSDDRNDHDDRSSRKWAFIAAGVFVSLAIFSFVASPGPADDQLEYFDFLTEVDDGEITSARLYADGAVDGDRADGTQYTTRIPLHLTGESLLDRFEAADIDVTAVPAETSALTTILAWVLSLLPIVLIVGIVVWMSRRARGFSGALGMGRNRARVFDADRPSTSFADVAGYDAVKEEISEIADFLSDPERYYLAGATPPKGVLMTGPPGTGKTLMARALAGEVGVPFFSVTGSSFVEMFVGVGASRVRDLFDEARKQAPAIIFVDEIDAIGQRRSGGAVLANDEREQTLNQLLAEMDGFEPTTGIIVLAATNRAEILDAALLRPGRFDRQVIIPLPNQAERKAILKVHMRGKAMADDDHVDTLARQTPGFSGADLANLVNEAAIRTARDGRHVVRVEDFDAAYDRILLGNRDRSSVLLPEERRAVAAHEAGHALVAALSDAADPVHRVTILPAGESLGNTQQLPDHERHLYSEQYLYDTLAVQLGGRAAELVMFGRASTGAANDLAMATGLATKMVREYGLSEELGPVSYPSIGPRYLTSTQAESAGVSEDTQRIIDRAVGRIVNDALVQAVLTLQQERPALESLTELLLHDETVDGVAVYELLGTVSPSKRPQVLQTRPAGCATSVSSSEFPRRGNAATYDVRSGDHQ